MKARGHFAACYLVAVLGLVSDASGQPLASAPAKSVSLFTYVDEHVHLAVAFIRSKATLYRIDPLGEGSGFVIHEVEEHLYDRR